MVNGDDLRLIGLAVACAVVVWLVTISLYTMAREALTLESSRTIGLLFYRNRR